MNIHCAVKPMAMLLMGVASLLLLGGCAGNIDRAVVVLHPTTDNDARGVILFTKVKGGVRIVGIVQGLQPNAKHAIHIHELGDARDPSGKGAGGHYNPKGHEHGHPDDKNRHAGDLGNLLADADGQARYDRVDSVITINGFKNSILGRGVIIHAGRDQFIGKTGEAGARIAIGVIGVAKSSQ